MSAKSSEDDRPKCENLFDRAAFRTAHTYHPGLGGQFLQQRLGLLEVSGVEAFGEPVVDFGEHRAGLVAAASIAQQAGKADASAEFEKPGVLPAGSVYRGA